MKARVPFELVDISPTTLHLALDLATDRLKAGGFGGLLYSHSYGDPFTPNDFFQDVKARHPELLVIDDRCLCQPALDVPETSIADVVLYSTGYAKQVELGGGGYAFVKPQTRYTMTSLPYDPTHYELQEARYKAHIRDQSLMVYRDDDWLQTDGGSTSWADYRQRIAANLECWGPRKSLLQRLYAEGLPQELQLPTEYQTWRFNLRLKDRDRILNAIFSAKLFASAHYASLAGIVAPGNCPNAGKLADQVINFFIDRHFDQARAEQLVALVRAHLR
jgi:hypothetical protein